MTQIIQMYRERYKTRVNALTVEDFVLIGAFEEIV